MASRAVTVKSKGVPAETFVGAPTERFVTRPGAGLSAMVFATQFPEPPEVAVMVPVAPGSALSAWPAEMSSRSAHETAPCAEKWYSRVIAAGPVIMLDETVGILIANSARTTSSCALVVMLGAASAVPVPEFVPVPSIGWVVSTPRNAAM